MDLCRSCWSGPAGRLASPDVADPSPAAPRWLRLVPVRALTAPVAVRPAVALCVSLRMFLEPPGDHPLRSDLVHVMLLPAGSSELGARRGHASLRGTRRPFRPELRALSSGTVMQAQVDAHGRARTH